MKNLERKRNVNCITDTNQDFCHILYWVTEYRYMYLIHMTWVRKHGSKSKQKQLHVDCKSDSYATFIFSKRPDAQ